MRFTTLKKLYYTLFTTADWGRLYKLVEMYFSRDHLFSGNNITCANTNTLIGTAILGHPYIWATLYRNPIIAIPGGKVRVIPFKGALFARFYAIYAIFIFICYILCFSHAFTLIRYLNYITK